MRRTFCVDYVVAEYGVLAFGQGSQKAMDNYWGWGGMGKTNYFMCRMIITT